MLKFAVLGSGSSGNSAVVCHGSGARVLIDAGLSARQLGLRLEAIGIDPDSITAVVLTHEHNDHCGGLDVFCRKRTEPMPVFATAHTCELVREKLTRSRDKVAWKKFEAGHGFMIDEMVVESFTVPHDAVDPVGFVFRGRHSALGVLSDVGHVTALIQSRLHDVDTLFVEANYDEVMLQNDIKRPWATKQRISSRHGHLSNDQTADLVVSVASKRLHRVVLGHLSDDCNTPEVACRAIAERLRRSGFESVEVQAAERKKPLPLCEAAKAKPSVYPVGRVEAEAEATRVEESAGERSASHHRTPDREKAAAPSRNDIEIEIEQAEWAF